jgi:hypothetical protein
MRIWHVDFGELDDQRVLGQHNEIHALWGLIVNYGNPWGGMTKEDSEYLWAVHEWSVKECAERGWPSGTNHMTPLPVLPRQTSAIATMQRLGKQETWEKRLERDRWDLVLRWGGVYKGRIEAPYDYVPLIGRYWAQGGCLHDGTREDFKRGWQLCLGCKRYATNDKGHTWVLRESVTDVKIRGRQ